jgi:hypothetical protein
MVSDKKIFMGISHRVLYSIKFGCGGHLGQCSDLPKLCPVIPTSNQDGRQAKNRKKGDEIKKKSSPLKLLCQSQPNFAEMILGCSEMPDIILKEDHPRIISAKFG